VKVLDVMSKTPGCCVSNETVNVAAAIMRTLDTGFVPVLQASNGRVLAGVVTDRDLVLEVLAQRRDAWKTPVSECMTSNPVCCQEDDSVHYAAQLMEENHLRRLPVVNHSGELCGVISIGDLVRHNALEPHRLRDLLDGLYAGHSSALTVRPEEALVTH